MLLIPVVFLQTVLPMCLSISIDEDIHNYEPGNYSRIAAGVAGDWLGHMITFGAVVSQTGMCNGASLISDEALQSFALRHNERFFALKKRSGNAIVRWMFDTNHRIAPVFVLFNSTLLLCFVWVCRL